VDGENKRLSAALAEAEEQRERLQEELKRIVTVDLAEYQRLRNEEEQYLKAKEILGKIFLVLFHNLLSGIPQDQVDFAKSLASSSGQPLAEKAEPQAHDNPTAVSPTSKQSPVESPVKTEVPSGWAQAEKNFSQVNANKAEDFLRATVIKDILKEQGDSRSFSTEDTRLQTMQGYYSGELTFLDPKRKPWSMEMDMSSEVKDGAIKGNFLIHLIDDQGRGSRLSQEGGISEILKPVTESKALIIRLYRTQFLQMYIFERQGLIIGNYYDEGKDGKVEHLGRFRMQRT
jgi:hypothetical protein